MSKDVWLPHPLTLPGPALILTLGDQYFGYDCGSVPAAHSPIIVSIYTCGVVRASESKISRVGCRKLMFFFLFLKGRVQLLGALSLPPLRLYFFLFSFFSQPTVFEAEVDGAPVSGVASVVVTVVVTPEASAEVTVVVTVGMFCFDDFVWAWAMVGRCKWSRIVAFYRCVLVLICLLSSVCAEMINSTAVKGTACSLDETKMPGRLSFRDLKRACRQYRRQRESVGGRI